MNTLTLNGGSHTATTLAADEPALEEELAFDAADPDDDALDFTHTAAVAVDEEDDEAFAPSIDLARLAGYDTSAEALPLPIAAAADKDAALPPVSTPSSSQVQSHADADDALDVDDADNVVDPRAVKTKHGFIGNPFTKLAVVGGSTLLVVTALGVFLTSVMGGHSNNSPVVVASPSPSPSVSPLDTTQDEVAKYKTDSALSRQKELLNGASKPQPLPTASAKPASTVTPTPTPTPTPIPLASPMAMPAAPATSVVTSPVPLPTATPVDPMEKWRMAATMGSYGSVPTGSSAGSANYTPPNVPVPVQAPVPFVPSVPATPSGNTGAHPLSQLRSSVITPGLRDRPLSPVLVGTTAIAQTRTGVVLAGDNTTPIAPDSPMTTKYLAQLKVDLKDANGAVALPTGSTLVMVARSFSPQTGMAEFVVVSVLVDNKEYTVPKDTLVVRGSDGGLVAFSKRGGSKGVQSLLPAFFAGLSQAGQILNQPSSSATVSGGSVSATTTSSSPSALAGFAQGFGNNLSQSMQQKAQAANQAAASAPASWQLGAGTEVKVFVNASFEL